MIPHLTELLELQETDLRLIRENQALQRFPIELQGVAREETELDQELEAERGKLRQLELKRKEHETELQSEEGKVSRFLTQQLSVKKNEEYKALETEIEHARQHISDEEETVLELLEEIDAARSSLKAFEEKVGQRRQLLASRRDEINAFEKGAREAIVAQEKLRVEQATALPPDLLERYEHVRTQVKRGPWVCPLVDHTCSGCHLRVTNGVYQAVRGGALEACDQCGRLLYVE